MRYEVKKDGKTYMVATERRAAYPASIERSLQRAGYEIYVDGKRKRRACSEKV